MAKTDILVACKTCDKEFYKRKTLVINSKTGNHFCSRNCSGKYGRKIKYGDSVGFSFYKDLCKKRAKKKNLNFDLTSEYIRFLFNSQNGKCAISGLNMVLNKRSRTLKDKTLYYASIDRIDNNKGYTKDNVQFVCLGVNYMRNTFSIDQTKTFIESLKNNNG